MNRNQIQIISDSISQISNALNDRGADPQYHADWLRRLSDEWTPLARALAQLLNTVGDPLPEEWQHLV